MKCEDNDCIGFAGVVTVSEIPQKLDYVADVQEEHLSLIHI